jgi:hypothetical protein
MRNNEVPVNLPPPVIPLKILNEPAPEPVPRPQGFRRPEPAAKKKKERRMELQGLEAGDPRSTVDLLKLAFNNTVRSLPPVLRKYGWLIPIILVIWTSLGTFSAYKMMFSMPALAPLWMFLDKIVLILVFLTASYNSFVGKAVYAAIIIRVIIPLIRRIRREGFAAVRRNFASLVPNLKINWSAVGRSSTGLFLCLQSGPPFSQIFNEK